jgi:hypothetical protein
MWLSIILLLLGVVILARAFFLRDEAVGAINARPLVAVLAGVVIFSLVAETWGFAIAGVLLIVIARLAGGRFRPIEVGVLAAALVGVSAFIFLYSLKLPLHLLPV